MTNGYKSRTLSHLVFRSAFLGQLFAVLFIAFLILIGVAVSLVRERKEICNRAKLIWANEQEKLVQLIVMGESRGAQLKLDQLRADGDWSQISIQPDGKTSTFKSISTGTRQSGLLACSQTFSYAGIVAGRYHFEYPLRPLWEIASKFLFALLSAMGGLFLVSLFQRRVLLKDVVSPIAEIQKNLRRLALGEEVAFAKTLSCDELQELQSSIELAFEQNQRFRDESERKKLVEETSKVLVQVAHNVRGPLTSLEMDFEGAKTFLPEDQRVLLQGSVDRFRSLATSLLHKSRELTELLSGRTSTSEATEEKSSAVHFYSLLSDFISEKRTLISVIPGITLSLELPQTLYGAFVRVQPSELRAILSNLINNAVESISTPGEIRVIASMEGENILLCVNDNGKGIPPDVLPKLMEMGATFGKKNGTGVGLYHARRKIEEWGGSIKIESIENVETKVSLTIPSTQPPSWFVRSIKLSDRSPVVIVDDDPSIHHAWQIRLDKVWKEGTGRETIHISTPSRLRSWLSENPSKAKTALYFVDHEFLGYRETGVDIIALLPNEKSAILVTSHAGELALQRRCTLEKIPLLPKGMLPYVPIEGGE